MNDEAAVTSVVARVAHGQERTDFWNKIVAIYAPYTDYQAKRKREIPVVVLDPVG